MLDDNGLINEGYVQYMAGIAERNKDIIKQYKENPHRGIKNQLAKKYKISRERVGQIIKRALVRDSKEKALEAK